MHPLREFRHTLLTKSAAIEASFGSSVWQHPESGAARAGFASAPFFARHAKEFLPSACGLGSFEVRFIGLTSSSMKKVFPVLLALCSLGRAQQPPASESSPPPPAHIDIKQLPPQSKLIDNVVVPVPSEIFGVLDKLGPKPHWTSVQRASMASVKPTGEQSQIALRLGVVIAEGFIAVEAEDTGEVKNIGNTVLTLSRALSVEKQVKERAKAITDSADKKDWQGVRLELDKTLNSVRDAMQALKSDELSQLVSLGGWLRGTEALTAVVSDSYTRDGAELLHQPMLIDYFEKRLAEMKPKIKQNPVVTKVQKGMLEIRPLVGVEDGTMISAKTVKEIGRIAEDLIKTINSKAP